jgi:hypothetical protein
MHHASVIFVMAVTLGVSACSRGNAAPMASPVAVVALSGPPVSLDEVRPKFLPGEAFTFEVTYKGIEGGRARMAIGEPAVVGDQRVLAVRADMESSGLVAIVKSIKDDTSTWLDADTGLPIRSESDANTSGKRIQMVTTFDHGARRAETVLNKEGVVKKVGRRLPDGETYDPIAAMLVLRGWDAPVGTRGLMSSFSGRTLWRSELVVEGKEELKTSLGKRMAVRTSGVAYRITASGAIDQRRKPRRFTVWVSDDEWRIPLRVTAFTEMGDVVVQATSYDGPQAVAAR